MIRNFFRFFARPDNLGVGVSNLALAQPYGPPGDGMYGDGRRLVKRSFAPTASPAYMMLNGYVYPVSLAGNGSDLTGQMALQSLVKMQGTPGQ